MKTLRILAVLMIAALVMAIVPATLAQDTQQPTFGLSQADFSLLQAANTATLAVQSLQFDYTLDMNVSASSSSSSGTSAAMTVTGNIKGGGGLDVTTTGSEAFQFTATGSIDSAGTPTPINFEARVANQDLFWNLSGQDAGWQGVALADIPNLVSGMMSQFSGMVPGVPSNLSSAMQPGSSGNSQMMQEMAPIMQALSQMNPENFVSMTRADEGGSAHFTINVDIKKILADPAVLQMVTSAAAMQGATAGSATGGAAGGMDPAQALQMAQTLMQTASIKVDQWVDTASQMVTRNTITVDVNVMSMSGGAPTVVGLTFDLNLHDFNTPFTVDAPVNATMIPVPTPQVSSK